MCKAYFYLLGLLFPPHFDFGFWLKQTKVLNRYLYFSTATWQSWLNTLLTTHTIGGHPKEWPSKTGFTIIFQCVVPVKIFTRKRVTRYKFLLFFFWHLAESLSKLYNNFALNVEISNLISDKHLMLGHSFFICWNTFHFEEFQSVAIGEKK